MSIEILPDAEALALRAADLFALTSQEGAAARGRFAAAFSGGETPRAFYRMLARQQFSQKIPWRRVQLYWGDERCVPPDDPASNYGMARDALLKHVPIAGANVHRVRGEEAPEKAALAYEKELRALAALERPKSELPVFDLVAPRPRPGRAHGQPLPAQRRPRGGGTPRSRHGGAGRLAARHRDLSGDQRRAPRLVPGERRRQGRHGGRGPRGPARAQAVPAQGVQPVHGKLTWLLDEAAAAELSPALRG